MWRQLFATFMTLAIWVAIGVAFGRIAEEDYKSFFWIIGVVSAVILIAYLNKKRNDSADKKNKTSK